jgi:D-alanyl-D-alanine carboxypeptidase/D-alanyl-D-alanine-endopeptidase (penicillin-binding protein 4)
LKSCRNSRLAILGMLALAAGCGTPAPAVAPSTPPIEGVRRLHRYIDNLLAAPALERATWGISIRSLARAEVVYANGAGTLLMPASAMKIITLAAAADRLGWDYTYETRLLAAGAIEHGVLAGDLVVVGSGDPTLDDWDGLATRLFHEWALRLQAAGVRSIGGRIIGDDNRFDDDPLGSGWAWDDLDRSFAAGVGAIQFNQNTAQLVVAPGDAIGSPAALAVSPAGSGLDVRSQVTTTAPGVAASLLTRRAAGSATLEARGSVPLGTAPFVRNVSAVNPTMYFLTRLRTVLVEAGIEVGGPAVDIDDIADAPRSDSAAVLVSHQSPTLAAIAVTMMKNSQNLYAETLLRSAAEPDQPRTVEAGRLAVRALLDRWRLPPFSAVVADGSGLSRYNLTTPDALVDVLAHYSGDDSFVAALPVAGIDGTLARRMKGTAAEANARAKTGTFSNARALAGYVRTAEGEPLAFAIIANNFGIVADTVENTMDGIVVALAGFRR